MRAERIILKATWDPINPDVIFIEYYKDKQDHLIIKKTCDQKKIKSMQQEIIVYQSKSFSTEQKFILQHLKVLQLNQAKLKGGSTNKQSVYPVQIDIVIYKDIVIGNNQASITKLESNSNGSEITQVDLSQEYKQYKSNYLLEFVKNHLIKKQRKINKIKIFIQAYQTKQKVK